MEGPRGHRGAYREPAIVNLAAGDDSECSLDPPLPIEGSDRWSWRVLGSGCGREFVQRLPVRIRFNPTRILSIFCGPACLSNPRSMCYDRPRTGERQFIKVH